MSTILTTNLVLQKTKLNSLDHVKRLNACGVQVKHIDVLRDTHNIEVLSLSVNNIEDINALSNCMMLRELFLRKNDISDIRQVLHLSQLDYLLNLGLSENAICEDSSYRPFVIAAIPSLTKLDDLDISPSERAAASRLFPDLHLMRPPTPIPMAEQQGGGSPLGNTNRGTTPLQSTPAASMVRKRSFGESDLESATCSGKSRNEGMRSDEGWDDIPVGGGRPARRPPPKQVVQPKYHDPAPSHSVPNHPAQNHHGQSHSHHDSHPSLSHSVPNHSGHNQQAQNHSYQNPHPVLSHSVPNHPPQNYQGHNHSVPNRGGGYSPPPRNYPAASHMSAPQPVHNYAPHHQNAHQQQVPTSGRTNPAPQTPLTQHQKMNALEDAAIEAVKALVSNMSPFALSEIRAHLDGITKGK